MTNATNEDVANIINACYDDVLNKIRGKKIVFAGCDGFLGNYFKQVFSQIAKDESIEFIGLDNGVTAIADQSQYSGICVRKFDLITDEIPKDLHDADTFVHCAGIASPFHYRRLPLETLDVTVIGLRKFLEVARYSSKNPKVIFFSSSEIYGDPRPEVLPIKESYNGNVPVMGARACYDESKRLGETLCAIYHEMYGVHTNTIRPFNVYGPGMNKYDYRVMSSFVRKVLEKEVLEVYGSGHQTRTFCYVTDALVGFLKVIANGVPGQPYNIGTPDQEISVIALAELFQQKFNARLEVATGGYPDSYPGDEPQRRVPDITKAREQLGFRTLVGLEEGVERFFKWAESHY